METTRLGMTELEVSRIAFGTWQIGGEWGEFDRAEAVAAIRHARDLGIDFFDTALAYGFGASERLLGEALRDDLDNRRDEVVIATKGGLRMDEDVGLVRDSSPAWLRSGVDRSLSALGVDHVDLYQVHWPDPTVPFAETAGALAEAVDAGKIRHVGVSNYDAEQMAEFARTRPVETLQPLYNLFQRQIEDTVLPYARQHDIGVLAYPPLAHGLLTGAMDEGTTFQPEDWRNLSPQFKGETFRRNLEIVGELKRFAADELGCSVTPLAVAWTLANPAVHVSIVGSRSPAHIEDSVGAVDVELSDDQLAAIDAIAANAAKAGDPHPSIGREETGSMLEGRG
jgi:aryl-alcohol dehydrogenase-like predicted oxidoreductase